MSANETRAIFVAGLKNAHAMENQALAIMKPQVKRIENYPEVAAKLQQHISETEGQILRLEEILTSLTEDHSSLKDMACWFPRGTEPVGVRIKSWTALYDQAEAFTIFDRAERACRA